MRDRAAYLARYGESHRNPTNQIIHMICVPPIFASVVAFAWLVKFGAVLSVVPAAWQNLAVLLCLPVLGFYARLGLASLTVGALWMAVSFAIILGIERAGLPLGPTALCVFVVAWIGQFVGHKIEGAKPSFLQDLLFLLIGPLFVQEEFDRRIWGRTQA